MERRAFFNPWCEECRDPLDFDKQIWVTLVRDPDGRIRSQEAFLYHERCFDQERRPTEVRIIRGYPLPEIEDSA